jgi:hypothetical protein
MAINLDDLKPYIVTPNPNDKIWLFYGEMATRKTSVACQFSDSLLIAFDIGYKLISNGKHVPAPIQTWADFKSIVKQLDKPNNKERFKTIIIDTVGMCYQACYNYMCTQMGVQDPGEVGYGMGWRKIRNEFETVVRSICQKGYGLIMLAHSDEVEKEDKISKQKTLSVKIDIDKRPDLIIKQLADFVFYLHKEVKDGTENEPTVYAYSNLVSVETKSRSIYFTPRFEFTYQNLENELKTAIERQYAEQGLEVPTNVVQDNPYGVEKVDFDELKADAIKDATILLEKGYENQVSELLLNVFKGTKISDLTETEDNIQKLQVVQSSLSELKAKARL